MADAEASDKKDEAIEEEEEDEAVDEDELKKIIDQQERYMKRAVEGQRRTLPREVSKLQEDVAFAIKFSGTSKDWMAHKLYDVTDVDQIALMTFAFFRLEEYHHRIMDAMRRGSNPGVSHRTREWINIMGNQNNKKLVKFLSDFMKACHGEIFNIHFAILGCRMHLENPNLSDIARTGYERMLRLFYDVCRPVFTTEPDTVLPKFLEPEMGISTERIDNALATDDDAEPQDVVVVQMLSGYAFPPCGPEGFAQITIGEAIAQYHKALGYVIIAVKIQRMFESLRLQRYTKGKNEKERSLTKQELTVYMEYQHHFEVFIDEDVIHINRHVSNLNALILDVYHVFWMLHDQMWLPNKYLERWETDNHIHFVSSRLLSCLKDIVPTCKCRRQLMAELKKNKKIIE